MKQHITPIQLNELSEKAKARLREWWKPKAGNLCITGEPIEMISLDKATREMIVLFDKHEDYYKSKDCLPLLSIGQMIEFLKEHSNDFVVEYEDSNNSWRIYHGSQKVQYKSNNPFGDDELCNALWEAVKEILEK